MAEEDVIAAFGNRLRVRVCGILIDNDRILMIKHHSVGDGYLWAPPGGGLEYGESIKQAVSREFAEETGLEVTVANFLCAYEFLEPPLHAIELFFWVHSPKGNASLGSDPEMKADKQIMEQMAFLSFSEINSIPVGNKHRLFSLCSSVQELQQLSGLL